MSTNYSNSSHLKRIRTIADFQFGRGVGYQLFPAETEFRLSSTKKVRYALLESKRIATLRAHDGRLTLSIEGAMRLHRLLPQPAYRVVIAESVAEFVSQGKNAMAKHVVSADPGIRAGDEVLIVDGSDLLIATGNANLSGEEMLHFNYGVAVNVRRGRK